jgi:hypothetical protein
VSQSSYAVMTPSPVMVGEGRPSTPGCADTGKVVDGQTTPDHDGEGGVEATIGNLLAVAFRHTISEPNIEAGYERFAALADITVSYDAFRDAIDACLRERLIREPIRLPEGALQCHWHLELTPSGVAEVRRLGLTGQDR